MLYEERYFLNPIFLSARFFRYPVRSEVDILDNELITSASMVAEKVAWEAGNKLEFCFTSALYGAYGDAEFTLEEVKKLPNGVSVRAKSDDLYFNVVFSERASN